MEKKFLLYLKTRKFFHIFVITDIIFDESKTKETTNYPNEAKRTIIKTNGHN